MVRQAHRRSVLRGPFDFGRRDADAVAVLQHLIRRHRLPIDSDQVVDRLAGADLLVEELLDRGPRIDFHLVRKAAAVVVDEQDSHRCLS